MNKETLVIVTGGTIDQEHDPINERLVLGRRSYIPDMIKQCGARNVNHTVLMSKNSDELTDKDRQEILRGVENAEEEAIIVTHGTITMVKTAEFLNENLPKDHGKTVVLTGSMRPYSLFQSDAPYNFGGALIGARKLPAGVYVTMHGDIHPAGSVVKNVKKGRFTPKDSNDEHAA